jgi:hypothetical protein
MPAGSIRLFIVGFSEIRRWTVQPIGQHEDAENHKHDDENVFDFHGFSLSE